VSIEIMWGLIEITEVVGEQVIVRLCLPQLVQTLVSKQTVAGQVSSCFPNH